jgi:hypothetical protein
MSATCRASNGLQVRQVGHHELARVVVDALRCAGKLQAASMMMRRGRLRPTVYVGSDAADHARALIFIRISCLLRFNKLE